MEPWTFEQGVGEAVFIPAGCPFQVRNCQVRNFFLKETNFLNFSEEIYIFKAHANRKRRCIIECCYLGKKNFRIWWLIVVLGVKNFQSTVHLCVDFLSPESLLESARISHEIRSLPNYHEAKLQILEVGRLNSKHQLSWFSLYLSLHSANLSLSPL